MHLHHVIRLHRCVLNHKSFIGPNSRKSLAGSTVTVAAIMPKYPSTMTTIRVFYYLSCKLGQLGLSLRMSFLISVTCIGIIGILSNTDFADSRIDRFRLRMATAEVMSPDIGEVSILKYHTLTSRCSCSEYLDREQNELNKIRGWFFFTSCSFGSILKTSFCGTKSLWPSAYCTQARFFPLQAEPLDPWLQFPVIFGPDPEEQSHSEVVRADKKAHFETFFAQVFQIFFLLCY